MKMVNFNLIVLFWYILSKAMGKVGPRGTKNVSLNMGISDSPHKIGCVVNGYG